MALSEILTLDDSVIKIGISEERIKAIVPVAR